LDAVTRNMQSIGKDAAVALAESEWWKDKSAKEIVAFQLFTEELCMPFGDFHKALEDSLGRPVWTHELGLNLAGIQAEFLGEAKAPTFAEILNLIPEDKRVLVVVPDGNG
jgi:hypothetical protein